VNVAVLGPSHVPFVWGGLDNLLWGLADHLNAATSHRAELFKIPTREHELLDLVESYRMWSELDFSSFDVVISSKYPTWMAPHPDHRVWMAHCLRGLYDTYPAAFPAEVPELAPEIQRSFDQLAAASRRGAVNREVAAAAVRLVELAARQQPDLLSFPGPFARAVVHALDAAALRPGRITRHAAISGVVAKRAGYFPPGVEVEVLYPPVARGGFEGGPTGDYFFCASRLDPPKRIDLVVKAFRASRLGQRLVIAGTGPERERLEALARGDPRIELAGFVSEAELRRLYAGCRAVVFVPFDEDFGYIALESQLAGKALVTATDSGGAAELTRHGVTGLVAEPSPEALAKALDALAEDAALAERLGAAGKEAARAVSWAAVADRLLAPVRARAAPRRRRIAVALPFPVSPVVGGGRARVFELYRRLASRMDVELVGLDVQGASRTAAPAPGLTEVVIGASPEHRRREAELSASVGWTPITDVALPVLERHTPELRRAVEEAAARADAVVASHPYAAPLLEGAGTGRLIYEAHNVELALKRAVLGRFPQAEPLLELTAVVERWCLQRAELTFACCDEDRSALASLYGQPRGAVVLVPNGVDPQAIPFASPEERAARRRALGLRRPTCLFLGSWHPPNLDAVERILEMAAALPGVDFTVVGNLDGYFKGRALPANVAMTGFLAPARKLELLHSADLALNPMQSGSGTNLKVLEYCAAGVPVVTTPVGLRGLPELRGACAVAEPGDFARVVEERLRAPPTERADVARARAVVEERYAWDGIADRAYQSLERLL